VKKYGRDWPADFTPAHIELYCMVHNLGPSDSALGRDRHLRNAMLLLWPHVYDGYAEPGILKWRDELELLVWAWSKFKITAVLGHASAAKTHTFGHIAAASFLGDAPNSIITLTSTHLSGLRKRLWADTEMACRSTIFGDIFDVRKHDMTIRPQGSKEDKYVIEGIATDRGADAVEKIQGTHSRNHRYCIIDEAQGTPPAIFEAAANLMTDPDFRMGLLANPTKRFSEFGTWCEPVAGWHKIDPEVDLWWETKRGGVCVRLDGLKSPNIKHGRTIFPFLIRQDYIDRIGKSYGVGSPRWWIFVRGWFPPEGLSGIIYPSNVLAKAEKPIVFQFPPKRCAALDPAFEGGDQCAIVLGEYGEAHGSRYALNITETSAIKVAVTEGSDPLDYLIAREVMRICQDPANPIAPEDFIMDVTGAGRGVAAILQKEWSHSIQRCNFGGSPTDRKLKTTDTETAEDLFDRFVSELWWAGRAWMEEDLVGGIDLAKKTLRDQLSAREYETVNEKKISIETKREMKLRLGYSPDEADGFTMLVELLRRKGATAGSTVTPATGTPDNRLLKRAQIYSAIEVETWQ
jgi:hypothetical protein